MFKNVSLRTRIEDARKRHFLIGPDGCEIQAFAAFEKVLLKSPSNTRTAYVRHLAELIDYLFEVASIVGSGQQSLTKLQLTEALEQYGDYLELGSDATGQLARKVAESLPPGVNSSASVAPKLAAVRRFLKLSEAVQKELAELAQLDPRGSYNVSTEPLLPGLTQKRDASRYEQAAMQSHSMLAGVLKGGRKLLSAVSLGGGRATSEYDHKRAFPYDKVLDLIEALPRERDKALYSLLAASGCRGHEAEQVLFEDIDLDEGTVRLVDPGTRAGHPSYRLLSPEARSRLAWKGRTTDLTLLIEPFATAFFESFQRYLEREHIPHGKHDFVFQSLVGAERGMPFFLSSAQARISVFHNARKSVGVSLPPRTARHSLRHMYATYALNYFPRANGDYGLPVPMVQQLLGQSNVDSTLKYARYDKDLLRLEIENANRVLYRHGTPRSILELKVDALKWNLEKAQAELAKVSSHD